MLVSYVVPDDGVIFVPRRHGASKTAVAHINRGYHNQNSLCIHPCREKCGLQCHVDPVVVKASLRSEAQWPRVHQTWKVHQLPGGAGARCADDLIEVTRRQGFRTDHDTHRHTHHTTPHDTRIIYNLFLLFSSQTTRPRITNYWLNISIMSCGSVSGTLLKCLVNSGQKCSRPYKNDGWLKIRILETTRPRITNYWLNISIMSRGGVLVTLLKCLVNSGQKCSRPYKNDGWLKIRILETTRPRIVNYWLKISIMSCGSVFATLLKCFVNSSHKCSRPCKNDGWLKIRILDTTRPRIVNYWLKISIMSRGGVLATLLKCLVHSSHKCSRPSQTLKEKSFGDV